MIPFDFDYYRPETVEETQQLFNQLQAEGKEPIYYGGGTEIISMARVNNISTGAVIDLKNIAECNILESSDEQLIMGSAVTLTRIAESTFFPLLRKAASRIADHSIQGKITLAGNICGTIIYREIVLPLLLVDSIVIIASKDGQKRVPIYEIFDQKIQLDKGDFITQFLIDKRFTNLPYIHVKKTRNEKIGYPLISLSAIKENNYIRTAFSGVCRFPFRSLKIEHRLNDKKISREMRINHAIRSLPAPLLNDLEGSAGYREFVFKKTLLNTLEVLEV